MARAESGPQASSGGIHHSSSERGLSYPGQDQVNNFLSESSLKKETERLSRVITRDILAYNIWLKDRDPNDFCVDMDVTPKTTKVDPIDEEEASARFRGHIKSIEQLGSGQITQTLELAHDRLQAQIAYREEIARVKAGEPKTPYDQYLKIIDGFGESDIERDALEERREKLIDCAIDVNIPVTSSNESLVEGLKHYNDANLLQSPKEVEAHYWRYATRFRTKFGQILGTDLSAVDYKMLIRYQNKFWKFYERIEKTGNALWLNWHERHRGEYNIAIVENYGTHEDSHFVVGEVIRQEIAEGRQDPLVGLITIPGPDAYYLEGIALTAHEWAGFNLTPDGNLGSAIYNLEKIALVKGFYLVEHGIPSEKAAKEIARYIPLKDLEQIKYLLDEGTTDPFARAFQPVYGRSVLDFEEIGNNLSPEKRPVFIRRVAKGPRKRARIISLVGEILVA